MRYKKQFGRQAKREFAKQMDTINKYCADHHINASANNDSYYFILNGHHYRVSNHSVESSYINSGGKYHPYGRQESVIYIHASKLRIIEIYEDLAAGYELDGHGNRKER